MSVKRKEESRASIARAAATAAVLTAAAGALWFAGQAAQEDVAPRVLWTRTSISRMTSAAVTRDGTVYVAGDYTTLYGLRLEDGAVLEEHAIGTVGASAPSIYDDTVVCSTLDGTLHLIDRQARQSTSADLGAPLRTSAAIDWRGIAYVGSDDGRLYAIDAATGGVLWSYDAGEAVRSSPVTDFDGRILFGCDDGVLRALSPTGDLVWATPLEGAVRSSVAVSPTGELYVGTESGWLYSLDPSDGGVLWSAHAGEYPVCSPVVDEWGDVYTCSLDGSLSCFGWNGRLVWRSNPCEAAGIDSTSGSFGSGLVGAPCLAGSGELYVLALSGHVIAFTSWGDFLWELDLAREAGWDPCGDAEEGTCERRIDLRTDFALPQLALTDDGTLLVSTGDQLTAIETESSGPPWVGWPTFQGNAQRTGEAIGEPADVAVTLSLDALSSWDVEPRGVYDERRRSMPSPAPPAGPPSTNLGPVASFEPLSDRFDRRAPSLFESTAIPPDDGEIVSQQWSVDGAPRAGDGLLEVQFSEVGDHTITLTVTDDQGRTDERTLTIHVSNLAPTASLVVRPADPRVGDVVRLDGSGSVDPDGRIVEMEWAFVDGRPLTGAASDVLELAFADPGTHEIRLTVTDSDGATDTASRQLRVSSAAAGPKETEGDRYALIIGISDYEDERIATLAYAEADANAFFDFAVDPDGGGFPQENSRNLIGEDASRKNIWNQIEWLLRTAGEGDLIVLYFAGHGGQDDDFNADEEDGLDEYLMPVDASSVELYSTAIRDDELGDWLASFEHRGARVLLILDSCHSGGASRGTRTGMGGALADVSPDSEDHVVLCASEEFEESFEDDELGHGVFTYYLLRGLGADEGAPAEADADEDGRVTVGELASYLDRTVPVFVTQEIDSSRSQHPIVYGGDQIIGGIWLSSPAAPVTGRVSVAGATDVLIKLDSATSVDPGDRFEILRQVYDPESNSIRLEVVAIVAVTSAISADHVLCSVLEHILPDAPIVKGLPVRAMVRSDEAQDGATGYVNAKLREEN